MVWNNEGKRLISAPVSTWTDRKKPSIVYATINLNQKSSQKEYWLKHRRPDFIKISIIIAILMIQQHAGVFNLTVLPFNSFLGPVKLN